jgi:hypothetical protein
MQQAALLASVRPIPMKLLRITSDQTPDPSATLLAGREPRIQ